MAPQSGAVPLKSWIAVKAESVCWRRKCNISGIEEIGYGSYVNGSGHYSENIINEGITSSESNYFSEYILNQYNNFGWYIWNPSIMPVRHSI